MQMCHSWSGRAVFWGMRSTQSRTVSYAVEIPFWPFWLDEKFRALDNRLERTGFMSNKFATGNEQDVKNVIADMIEILQALQREPKSWSDVEEQMLRLDMKRAKLQEWFDFPNQN